MAFRWLAGRRIMLVRHGNTGKAVTDAERQITELGERQCAAFKASYGAQLSSVRFAFASPVARTMTTASLLLNVEVMPVPDLYFGNIVTEEHRAVDSQIGHAPVQDYLRDHSAIYEAPAKRMVAALDAAGATVVTGDDGGVLVVSHAMYISLLTLELITALSGSALSPASAAAGEQTVLSANLGEVEGFEISAEGAVRYLRNHEKRDTNALRNDDFVAAPEQ
jgi:broad specificity phosphatase PhoE